MTYSVYAPRKQKITGDPPGWTAPAADRRRIGMIVRDDRGLASVEWRDAPVDNVRPVFEIEGNSELALNSEASYDPYSRPAVAPRRTSRDSTSRTDLRRLSEWIKMQRALEERELRGGDDDADDES